MNIYYQWNPGAYSHQVSIEIAKFYNIPYNNIKWVFSFKNIFEETINEWIWIIPIENSYAGSVHENFYYLSSYPIKIIWEFYLKIEHCLVSTGKNIKNIKKAYSHYQALMQCENYLKKRKIQPHTFWDTAWAAKHIKEKNNPELSAISSAFSAKIYGLNILDKWINDQNENTTRFFIIVRKNSNLKNFSNNKKNSLIFKVKDIPAVLYKCLWSFATRNINLTKIESLPTKEGKFEYMFWIDFEKKSQQIVDWAIKELKYFAKEVKILWDY